MSNTGQFYHRIGECTNRKIVYEFFFSMAQAHNLKHSVIVLDNHKSHHTPDIQELCFELGCELLYLPSASSVLNPVEVLWAIIKHRWR